MKKILLLAFLNMLGCAKQENPFVGEWYGGFQNDQFESRLSLKETNFLSIYSEKSKQFVHIECPTNVNTSCFDGFSQLNVSNLGICDIFVSGYVHTGFGMDANYAAITVSFLDENKSVCPKAKDILYGCHLSGTEFLCKVNKTSGSKGFDLFYKYRTTNEKY